MFLLGCSLPFDSTLMGLPWSEAVSDMNRITYSNNKQTQWSNTIMKSSAICLCSGLYWFCGHINSTIFYTGSEFHFFFVLAEISEYEDGRRRSLSVQEGSTVLIECPLPHSVPPALPRLRVRGERIEVSTGLFDKISYSSLTLFQIISFSRYDDRWGI